MENEARIVTLEVTVSTQTQTLAKMADAFEKLLVIEQNQLHSQADTKKTFDRVFDEIKKIDEKFDHLAVKVNTIETLLPSFSWSHNIVSMALIGIVASIAYYVVTKLL